MITSLFHGVSNAEMIQIIMALIGSIGVILTAIVSVYVAKMHKKTDVQKFYQDKIASLLETQSREIHELKEENALLTKEVRLLNEKIIELQKESRCSDCPIDKPKQEEQKAV